MTSPGQTYMLPLIASNTRLLWLDASDTATETTSDTRLIQWARKDGSGSVASAPLYAFGSDLTAAVQSTTDQWRSACVSSDGTVVVCMSDDLPTRTIISYNGGVSFGSLDELNNVVGTKAWTEISISADGTVMVVGGFEHMLFVSNNKGLTWRAHLTDAARFWEWTSMSSSGQHILASCYGDYVYTSSDAGATWRQLTRFATDETDVGFVWVSATGMRQVIAYYGGSLHISNDYGITWRDTTISGYWYEMVANERAMQMVAFTSPGYVYQSLDNGATFVPILADVQREFIAVAVSSNGRTIAAAAAADSIYVSLNAGVAWAILNTGPQDWSSMVMTASGDIFATVEGLHAPYIWKGGVLASGADAIEVHRSDIQPPLAIDVSGRSFALAVRDGSILVNQPSREPIVGQFASKACITFVHSSLDIAQPLFPDSATGFTCIMVVQVTALNSAPCISIGPDHYILLTTGPTGVSVKWGAGSPAAGANRSMDPTQWAVVAFYVGTTVSPQIRIFFNGGKVLDRIGTVSEPPANTPLRIGGSADTNDDFAGRIGELLVYRGDLQAENLSGWNDVHSYLGRKFAVYAALPQLSGIGSDPHLMQLTGGTFDVTQPGDYTLLQVGTFKMKCHISSIKQGIFMDTLTIVNGSHTARVVYKSRGIKMSSGAVDPLHELRLDVEDSIKWDIRPSAPKRFVKVLCGTHPLLGRFWIRCDYKHRYMTPYFPSFNKWSMCTGILVARSDKRNMVETKPHFVFSKKAFA